MRRPVIFAVAVIVCLGSSVAVATVSAIESPAEVGRTAYRIAPPFRPDMDPNERVALEMVELVNLERNRRGLPTYQVDARVSAAAMAHSVDMAARRQLVHLGADGSDTGARLDREGFDWRVWGEAIGGGYTTPEPLFDAWMQSPAHRPHLLSENRYIGVGVAATPDGVPYWTLVVAS